MNAMRILVTALFACSPRDFTSREMELLEGLTGLADPPVDRSNAYERSPAAIQLGHTLYYDRGFSGVAVNQDLAGHDVPYGRTYPGGPLFISCADCHDPLQGGIDHTSEPNQVSIGAGVFNVNAPSTINLAYQDLYFWNGRADSVWAVSAIAAEASVAFNGNRLAIGWSLFERYRIEYEDAFPDHPLPFNALDAPFRFPRNGKPGRNAMSCDPGTGEPFDDSYDCMGEEDRTAVTRTLVNFAKALAAFQSTLLSTSSAFDRHLDGGDPMSVEAIRGARLFVGKAACIECHSTPLLTDRKFHNTGVPGSEAAPPSVADCNIPNVCDCPNGAECIPWGAYDGAARLAASPWRRDGKWSDDPTDDSRARHYSRELTGDLVGAWRTPSLRDVALTAPYMHNGVYATLEDVIWHYDRGGTRAGVASENKSPALSPLGLDPEEVHDLVAFLEALTGDPPPNGGPAETP
jgi:cytochrome c peroxidase